MPCDHNNGTEPVKSGNTTRRTVQIELSEGAYHALVFHAQDCGYPSIEECVRRDIGACVRSTFESLDEEQIEQLFKTKVSMR